MKEAGQCGRSRAWDLGPKPSPVLSSDPCDQPACWGLRCSHCTQVSFWRQQCGHRQAESNHKRHEGSPVGSRENELQRSQLMSSASVTALPGPSAKSKQVTPARPGPPGPGSAKGQCQRGGEQPWRQWPGNPAQANTVPTTAAAGGLAGGVGLWQSHLNQSQMIYNPKMGHMFKVGTDLTAFRVASTPWPADAAGCGWPPPKLTWGPLSV